MREEHKKEHKSGKKTGDQTRARRDVRQRSKKENKALGALSFLKYSCWVAAPLIKRREERGEGGCVSEEERESSRKGTEELPNRENESEVGNKRLVNGGSHQIRIVRGVTGRTRI